MVQNKLKSIEDTICWINHEEALFKLPQSSYPDIGDMNVSFDSFSRSLVGESWLINIIEIFIRNCQKVFRIFIYKAFQSKIFFNIILYLLPEYSITLFVIILCPLALPDLSFYWGCVIFLVHVAHWKF